MSAASAIVKLHEHLLTSGAYSDMSIDNGTKVFSLHRNIMLLMAPAFAKLKVENSVIAVDDDTTDLENLIKWAYLLDIAALQVARPIGMHQTAAELIHFARLAGIAHKYGATDLEMHATIKFTTQANKLVIGAFPIVPAYAVTEASDQGKVQVFLGVARCILGRMNDLPPVYKTWVQSWIDAHAYKCLALPEFQQALSGFLKSGVEVALVRDRHGRWMKPWFHHVKHQRSISELTAVNSP